MLNSGFVALSRSSPPHLPFLQAVCRALWWLLGSLKACSESPSPVSGAVKHEWKVPFPCSLWALLRCVLEPGKGTRSFLYAITSCWWWVSYQPCGRHFWRGQAAGWLLLKKCFSLMWQAEGGVGKFHPILTLTVKAAARSTLMYVH